MRPHDANGLAVHVEAYQPVELEVPLPRAVGGAMHLPVEAKHEGHGVFSYGMRRIGWHAHNGNMAGRGSVKIHVVELGAA